MSMFSINAIQQIGVGTMDFRASWDWYIKMFGFDVKILEDDTIAERMLPYTGGKAQKRHACIAVNLQGGGGLEIWQYSERKPLAATFTVAIGDLGIFAAKIKCRDVEKFHAELVSKKCVCSPIGKDPGGCPCFYVKDPYGNTFQIIERKDIFIEENRLCGGIVGAFVGVSDITRSLTFYREVLGYDEVIYDREGKFEDWETVNGSGEKYRRVLISRKKEEKSAFSELLGTNTIELVQALDRNPRKIYEGRQWGDPGFIQICYDVTGMTYLGKFCNCKGFPFTVDSCPGGEEFDMGEASGHFTYVEDPDGTLIEFVETHRIPLIAKLGLYINIKKRSSRKPLSKLLFKIMGLISRQ